MLSKEAEKIANSEQIKHSQVDERKGIIERYLDNDLPEDWDDLELEGRRDFILDEFGQGKIERQYVCVAEIWCECLGKDRDSMSRYNTRDINDIMKSLDFWEYVSSTRNFKLYGKQKYYRRLKLD